MGRAGFDTFNVVPPGIGIVHQVNLEYLAKGVLEKDGVFYPDTLVGTDSHTTMINGLGVVGWGVGGIEAEAGMLGQPVTFLVPEVVGVHLTGELATASPPPTSPCSSPSCCAKPKSSASSSSSTARARRRSQPARPRHHRQHGARIRRDDGLLRHRRNHHRLPRGTGRPPELCKTVENYYKAQGLWGIPTEKDALEFSQIVELDLSTVKPGVAGPKRPQDRIELDSLKAKWASLLTGPAPDGYDKQPAAGSGEPLDLPPTLDDDAGRRHRTSASAFGAEVGVVTEPNEDPAYPLWEVTVDSKGGVKDTITHGSVLIAAITVLHQHQQPERHARRRSARAKGQRKGLTVKPSVKTSLGPGSRVVTDYLNKTGLQAELDKLGFQTVGYGCTTCIGNSGPLDPGIEEVVKSEDIIAASVLSGNRNFEARVHQSIKANFLMSPPLVVAFAIAGTVDIDMENEPLGFGSDGHPVYLRDIWPTSAEIEAAMTASLKPEVFQRLYTGFADQNPKWNEIKSSTGDVYEWDRESTYIQEPPFFDGFTPEPARHRGNPRRAPARHLRRLRHHRPHLARRRHQEGQPRRPLPGRTRRRLRGFQLLRLAPRQRPRHDPRHLRQRPHQEPHGPRHRRRRHPLFRRPAKSAPT